MGTAVLAVSVVATAAMGNRWAEERYRQQAKLDFRLFRAIRMREAGAVSLLLSEGANPNARLEDWEIYPEFANVPGCTPEDITGRPAPADTRSVAQQYYDHVSERVSAWVEDARAGFPDDRTTPLGQAALNRPTRKGKEIFQALLAAGASPDSIGNVSDDHGQITANRYLAQETKAEEKEEHP